MTLVWDAIVVGGGPGGAITAYGLSKSGLRVLLLEEEKIPRYKPCGGGLTPKVRAVVDFDFTSTIEQICRQLSVAFCQERMQMPVGEMWCMMRDRFDALLVDRAASAGAVVRDGQRVTEVSIQDDCVEVKSGAGVERACLIVGADGANGLVRKAMGLPGHTRIGAALEAEMEVRPDAMDEWRGTMHFDFGAIPWGYAWIFPKADHLSVGIGALQRPVHSLDLKGDLARYITSEPSLHDAKTRLMRGHRIPLGGTLGTYHAKRSVLVGDAAGIVDPFIAEGIYYALHSGQIAAEEITTALHNEKSDLSSYTQRINREISADLRYAWLLTQVFYRIPHLAYRIFRRSHIARDSVARMTEGTLTYRQLLIRLATGIWTG